MHGTIPIYHVDAFTDKPFAGNPAAVCILESPMPEDWMQSVAGEMNLAETAFVCATADGFDLRWFTPAVEVDLCGHATLASAHVLWETERLGRLDSARFSTRSGILTCVQHEGLIEMDFPAEPASPTTAPPGLLAALGVEAGYVGRNRFDYLVEVKDAGTLRTLKPDLRRIAEISARGIIVTCRSDEARYDVRSRLDAPAAGIEEDPPTGSAHCCLGPFWQAHLGRSSLTGYQASRRGGIVGMKMQGDRVRLSGHAVTVLRGALLA
jgi:PhzF family phenazine biosynthesis protein